MQKDKSTNTNTNTNTNTINAGQDEVDNVVSEVVQIIFPI